MRGTKRGSGAYARRPDTSELRPVPHKTKLFDGIKRIVGRASADKVPVLFMLRGLKLVRRLYLFHTWVAINNRCAPSLFRRRYTGFQAFPSFSKYRDIRARHTWICLYFTHTHTAAHTHTHFLASPRRLFFFLTSRQTQTDTA